MNLKNCKYMASTEFKARQLWLDFKDAIGAALEVLAEVKKDVWEWFKKWKGAAMKCKFDNRTLELNFDVVQGKHFEDFGIRKFIDEPIAEEQNIIDVEALRYFGIGSGWIVLSRNIKERICIKIKRINYPHIFKCAEPQ